jgi:hypothetical protein
MGRRRDWPANLAAVYICLRSAVAQRWMQRVQAFSVSLSAAFIGGVLTRDRFCLPR